MIGIHNINVRCLGWDPTVADNEGKVTKLVIEPPLQAWIFRCRCCGICQDALLSIRRHFLCNLVKCTSLLPTCVEEELIPTSLNQTDGFVSIVDQLVEPPSDAVFLERDVQLPEQRHCPIGIVLRGRNHGHPNIFPSQPGDSIRWAVIRLCRHRSVAAASTRSRDAVCSA